MEITWRTTLYKIAYGAIFILFLPLMLYYWSVQLDRSVHLPLPGFAGLGILHLLPFFLLLMGATFLLGGWYALFKYGRGLPMNAFPPERFVTRGVYAVTPHPIYTGFCLVVIAAFLLLRSPGGVWVIAPVVCLACIALVYGYEKEAIITHFGRREQAVFFSIPTDSDEPGKVQDIISVYGLVLLPWLIMYETIQLIGIPADHFSLSFNFEKQIPVVEWTELFYVSVYPAVLLFPVFLRSKSSLRKFSLHALYATVVCFLLYLVFPVTAEPRYFVGQSALGALLHFEQAVDTPACAFPSFHVIWAFICAAYYGKNSSVRIMLFVWAVLVSLSCVLTGMHSLADVAAGYGCYFVISKRRIAWQGIRVTAEKIANSWAETSVGKVRFINHGLWAAVGVLFGLTIVLSVLTPEVTLPVIVIALSSLVGAGLWAQLVEGSSGLLRPYGYYGGVIGVIIGSTLVYVFTGQFWPYLTAFSIAAPVIQSFGRCRCLVQGCCHGKPVYEHIGIHYFHPNSRVTRMAKLRGVSVHPTPVYSILWNIVIFALLLRLYILNGEPNLITGFYLILTGLGRFVEESLRGEPQTKIIGGLRLYNWIAIGTVLCGALITTIPSGYSFPVATVSLATFITPLCIAVIVYFALGVDVPSSNKRFSRLT